MLTLCQLIYIISHSIWKGGGVMIGMMMIMMMVLMGGVGEYFKWWGRRGNAWVFLCFSLICPYHWRSFCLMNARPHNNWRCRRPMTFGAPINRAWNKDSRSRSNFPENCSWSISLCTNLFENQKQFTTQQVQIYSFACLPMALVP